MKRELSVRDKDFNSTVKDTYEKVINCMKQSRRPNDAIKGFKFKFPDDAEEHYRHLNSLLSPFRKTPTHKYGSYGGPWLENIFVQHFSSKPLHYFNGLIPLIVTWVDNERFHSFNGTSATFERLHKLLNANLRPDVLYFTLSQSDLGLKQLGDDNPNILVFSAGGNGHIPIPLIKGNQALNPIPPKWGYDLAFFGTSNQAPRNCNRSAVLQYISDNAMKKWNFKYASGKKTNWVAAMAQTKFNLAPRGFGRTSFRFVESIHIGRVPIFIYEDIPWLPYQNTPLDIREYGYVLGWTRKNTTQAVLALLFPTIPLLHYSLLFPTIPYYSSTIPLTLLFPTIP